MSSAPTPSTPAPTDPTLDAKAVRCLARSVHRQLRDAGYSSAQVVDFASTMLDLVRCQFQDEVQDGQGRADAAKLAADKLVAE